VVKCICDKTFTKKFLPHVYILCIIVKRGGKKMYAADIVNEVVEEALMGVKCEKVEERDYWVCWIEN